MHFSVFKKNINLKRFCAVFLSLVVTIFAFSTPFVYAAYHTGNETTVVLDAGHGGIDGGVTGIKTGVKESVLNLKIVRIVGEYLTSAGFRVVYTRYNDNGLYKNGSVNFKREDMQKRGQIINASKASAVVSIHMNSYASPTRRGAQVFFYKKNMLSVRFADTVQEILNRDINSEGAHRDFDALSAEKYILECSRYPTIIIECGFLSSPLDEANLIKPDYQIKIAYTIAQGIIIFLSTVGTSF